MNPGRAAGSGGFFNSSMLPPPALDGERAGMRLPRLRQMRGARLARRLGTLAALMTVFGLLLSWAEPSLRRSRTEQAPNQPSGPVLNTTRDWAPTVSHWMLIVAVGLAAGAVLAFSTSWVQRRQARIPIALARRMGINLEVLRVRAVWTPWAPWRPWRIWIRYPSGWVDQNPAESLVELFRTDFGLDVEVEYRPESDRIIVRRARQSGPVEHTPRIEDLSPTVAGVQASVEPLLTGLTVDQTRTKVEPDGSFSQLVLTYDRTTKDVSPRFRARVQSVLEAKVPSPTGAWTIRWHPDEHTVEVVPSEALPEHALNEGVPSGHRDPLALPLGLGSGGRVLSWRPNKYPHMLLAGTPGAGKTSAIRTVLVMALLKGWRVWILDPKQTSFQYFKDWPGVERVAITGDAIRDALIDHRTEMQKVYAGLLQRRITHDEITPLLLIFDEVTEGLADVVEWVEEHFEQLTAEGEKLTRGEINREMKRAELATWRVTRKGREARCWQLLGLQRPDTRFIPGEARDNLITRIAAGHMRPDGLAMVFEDSGIKQRVTRPKIDEVTGEDRGEPIPGRATVDVGDGPEPLQWFWTPDPAPGNHTEDQRQLLESLREQVTMAQAARQAGRPITIPDQDHPDSPDSAAASRRPVAWDPWLAPGVRQTPGLTAITGGLGAGKSYLTGTDRSAESAEDGHPVTVPAGRLRPGMWIWLDPEGTGVRPVEVVDIEPDELADTLVSVHYLDASGRSGIYDVDRNEQLELADEPDASWPPSPSGSGGEGE